MPSFRLSCHDIFLALAVFYAVAELLIAWDEFRSCEKPIQIWLLVGCLSLLAFRAVHILAGREEEGTSEPWYFNLFTQRYRLLTVLIVCAIYPFFLGWVLLGTLWYAEVSQDSQCFRDQQENWYFVLWLVIFYIWVIGYNTAIVISAVIYYRGRTLQAEYVQLVQQYGDSQPPDPNFSIYGLSPGAIQGFHVLEINTPLQGEHICSVCQDDIKYAERARVLSCGHIYHLSCIDGWLMRQHWCPNCKRDLRRRPDSEQPLIGP